MTAPARLTRLIAAVALALLPGGAVPQAQSLVADLIVTPEDLYSIGAPGHP